MTAEEYTALKAEVEGGLKTPTAAIEDFCSLSRGCEIEPTSGSNMCWKTTNNGSCVPNYTILIQP